MFFFNLATGFWNSFAGRGRVIEKPVSFSDQKCVRMHKRFALDIILEVVKLFEASLKSHQTLTTSGFPLAYNGSNGEFEGGMIPHLFPIVRGEKANTRFFPEAGGPCLRLP